LLNIIQNDDNNKQHQEHINAVKQQISLMTLPVKSLLQDEVYCYMITFINRHQTFLGSERIIEDLKIEMGVIPAKIESLKFQRKKNNLKKNDVDDYSTEIAGLKIYKKFLKAAHNRLTKEPQFKNSEINEDKTQTFEDLFYNPEHATICLRILNKLDPPFIDDGNNYIGKNKGVFPLWVRILYKQELIKHCHDKEYSKILNDKINGLNLTEDGSEFRKNYARLAKNKIDLDIKTILSQFSQDGKLGK